MVTDTVNGTDPANGDWSIYSPNQMGEPLHNHLLHDSQSLYKIETVTFQENYHTLGSLFAVDEIKAAILHLKKNGSVGHKLDQSPLNGSVTINWISHH